MIKIFFTYIVFACSFLFAERITFPFLPESEFSFDLNTVRGCLEERFPQIAPDEIHLEEDVVSNELELETVTTSTHVEIKVIANRAISIILKVQESQKSTEFRRTRVGLSDNPLFEVKHSFIGNSPEMLVETVACLNSLVVNGSSRWAFSDENENNLFFIPIKTQ